MKKIVAILIVAVISVLSLFATGTAITSANSDIKINEVMFIPSPGDNEWVELYNTGTSSVNIDNYDITDEDDNTYTIPSALPDLPPDNYVVIIYDGLGSGFDDYDFSDGKGILHTPAGLSGDVFKDVTDTCILYTGSPHDETTKVDFVAWGDYPFADKYINTILAPGSPGVPSTNETIGLHPEMYDYPISYWVIYQPEETTQGSKNSIPRPILWSPQDGIATSSTILTFGWRNVFNVKNYHFQVDDNDTFDYPVIDMFTTVAQYTNPAPLSIGTYYWRVKTIDNTAKESIWSDSRSFTIVTPGGVGSKDLGIAPKLQHKDTQLLCLECKALPCGDTGTHSWDNEHKDAAGNPVRGCPHDDTYCARASISMIASYFKGTLSQDRISYEGFGSGDPEGDFGHGVGMWPHRVGISGIPVIDWALNLASGTAPRIIGKPTFADVKTWINNSRPILVVIPSGKGLHCVVIDGYDDPDGTSGNADDEIHVIDPWSATEDPNVRFATYVFNSYYVPPAGAKARSDEASVKQDPDNDGSPRFCVGTWEGKNYNAWGIMTFDEEQRFKTGPKDADSDNDCIQDKVEVWSYVFGGKVKRVADTDGDGKRAELDPDTDRNKNDRAVDGAEDKNRDGNLDSGETDPFDEDDDNNAPGQETKDFGDAPDKPYPSKLASNGARHSVFAFEWLGKDVNGEHDSKQVDRDEHDDGVTFVGTPKFGSPFRVIVTVNTSGMGAARYRADDKLHLNAWIDWNGNGEWQSFEKIIGWNGGPGLNDVCTKGKLVKPTTPWPVGNNSRVLEFDVTVPVTTIPEGRIGKPYYSRFRLDYDENVNTTTGPAKFGEVEDHDLVEGEWRAKWPTVLWYVQKGTKYSIEIFLNKTGYVTRVDFERLGCPVTEIPVELAEQSLAKLPPGFAIELPEMVTETMYKNSITQPVDVSEIPKMFTVYP